MRSFGLVAERLPKPRTETSMEVEQFSRMLQSLLPSLSRYAQSLSRNADVAQDLVQDAVLRAWRNQATFVAGTNMKAWLFRILRNGFINQMRRRRVTRTDTYGDDFPQVAAASNQELTVVLGDIQRLWIGLTPEQRRAIELIGIDGETYEAAAAMEGVSVGTMKSRAARGRQALRGLVEGERQLNSHTLPETNLDRTTSAGARGRTIAPSPEADRAQVELLRAWLAERR